MHRWDLGVQSSWVTVAINAHQLSGTWGNSDLAGYWGLETEHQAFVPDVREKQGEGRQQESSGFKARELVQH